MSAPGKPDPAGWQARVLGAEHAGRYRALMLEAYRLHPEAFTSSEAERAALPLAWWEARLDTSPGASQVVLGVFHGQALAGVAGLAFETREKTRHKATLFGMYVPRRYRGAGVGRVLVQEALALARERSGVRVVMLTVTHGNHAAQLLYERCGFLAFGIEPYAVAVGEGHVSKVHMWCDLAAASRAW